MAEENNTRQTFTYTMRPENCALLDELAKEFNTTKSRMIENLIIEKHGSVFKDKKVFANE